MKKLLLTALVALGLLGLTGCQSLDVIGKDSVRAFGAVLETAPELVTEIGGDFTLTAPDGSALLFWNGEAGALPPPDLMMCFPIQPFLDAGLDPAKLPAGMLSGEELVITADLSIATAVGVSEGSPLRAFEWILWHARERVMYHTAMDHFGISLDDGSMFEWARDMEKNDADIVFALNPQRFIDAGADPARVAGWTFAKVEVMEDNGRKLEADKLLKSFNLI